MIKTSFHRFNGHKILLHSDRLQQIAEGGLPYPIDWHIYPSNICNHKCTWCMFRQNGEQANFRVKLPKGLLLRAVDDAARTGAKLIHFSGGGEPLLNPHTLEAMRRAKEKGLTVAMSTNGRLLHREVAETVDHLRVSLNAGTKEQHWKTNHGSDERDPGDWDIILEKIAECAPYARLDMGLGFVVDYENWQDIYPFVELAAKLFGESTPHKQRYVHIRPGFYYDAEKDAKTRACMSDAFAMCEAAKRAFGGKIDIYSLSEKFDGYWTPRTYNRCHAIKTGVTLRATGDFAVCQDRTDLVFGKSPSYAMGASFEDVWHSQEHKDLMNTVVAGAELGACPRCVWNNRNNIIQDMFLDDVTRKDMI